MKTEYEKVLLPNSVQQELEKLRTQAIAYAAEIARLQIGFDDIKSHCELSLFIEENYDGFNQAHNQALRGVLKEINRITGADK